MAKIVVLARESLFGYYLINRIAAEHQVIGVVWENISLRKKLAILRRRVKRLGLRRVMDQLLLKLFSLVVERNIEKKKVKVIFESQNLNQIIQNIPVLMVQDVNTTKVEDFVVELKPDLIIISGISVLAGKLLVTYAGRIINIHVGITPEYRGAHGGFWAAYNGEPEKAGVTVHLVNAGIDTGAILFQEKVSVEQDDTPQTIVYTQQKTGTDLVLKAIGQFQDGKLKGYTKPDSPSRLYYSPGLTHYLRFKRGRRKPRNQPEL